MKSATSELLKGLHRPAFTVKNRKIDQLNEEAEQLKLTPGTDIGPLLLTNMDTYEAFDSGTLFLAMNLHGQLTGITVTRYPDCDLFALDEEAPVRLQALALAAKSLRGSFSEMHFVTERIKQDKALEDPYLQTAYEHSSMRLHRLISNMADAANYVKGRSIELNIVNLKSLFDEVFEKTSAFLGEDGPKIVYHSLKEPLVTMADPKKLERAVYNLLSNAIKFTPKDGVIEAWLTQHGSQLQLTIQDNGEGIADRVWSNLFTRYHRPAGIEDCRHGLGLGLLLVSCIAIMHGGTLLVQKVPEGGTKVAFTMSLQKMPSGKLFTHPLVVDYEGGRNPALLELSDVLPPSAYSY